jgi:hypothetical protein
VVVAVETDVVNNGLRFPLENEVTVPPPPVAISELPLKARPEPSVISLGDVEEPVGLPSSVLAASF